MKVGRIVTSAGLVITVFGIIFHLQGLAVVGPESSFMYSNPDWITYGIQVAVTGAVVFGTGVVLMFLRRN